MSGMKSKKTMKLWILYGGILLTMVGYGIAMPLLPFYIDEMGGRGSHLGLLIATYGLMQLIFAPIWGGLTDDYGRKPFILLGLLGLSLGMILMGFARSLWMLYLAQGIGGIFSCGIYPSAMAMISDVYRKDQRSAAMGRVGAAAGLGVIIGPGLGGLLAVNSLRTPFMIAAGFALITALVVWKALPETLKLKKSTGIVSKADSNTDESTKPIQKVLKIWKDEEKTTKTTNKGRPWEAWRHHLKSTLALGLIAAFFVNFGKSNFTGIYGYYALERFGFGPQQVGGVLMAMSFMYALAQGVFVAPLTKVFQEKTLINGIFLGIALGFFLVILSARAQHMILAMGVLMFMLALLKPVSLTYIANRAEGREGAVMGIAESFMSMGRIIGPLWAGFFFDLDIFLPYLSGGLIFFGLFLFGLNKQPFHIDGKEKESKHWN